jgi:hypothetical protein
VLREGLNPSELIKKHLENTTVEVEKGKVKENTASFLKFKSKHFYIWGDI